MLLIKIYIVIITKIRSLSADLPDELFLASKASVNVMALQEPPF